jgi:dihydrofolate reductase
MRRNENGGVVGNIIVSEFVTLDGVAQDPGGAEDSGLGGWAFRFDRGSEGDRLKLEEVQTGAALLLGRVTYEGFAEAWPSRSGEFADLMNSMPKYVVSTTLTHADWNNTTIISGDVAARIGQLKDELHGEILVAGSLRLVQTLIEHDLVDEYRLIVYPTVVGNGTRLFPDGGRSTDLRLTHVTQAGDTVILIYRPPVTPSGATSSS